MFKKMESCAFLLKRTPRVRHAGPEGCDASYPRGTVNCLSLCHQGGRDDDMNLLQEKIATPSSLSARTNKGDMRKCVPPLLYDWNLRDY